MEMGQEKHFALQKQEFWIICQAAPLLAANRFVKTSPWESSAPASGISHLERNQTSAPLSFSLNAAPPLPYLCQGSGDLLDGNILVAQDGQKFHFSHKQESFPSLFGFYRWRIMQGLDRVTAMPYPSLINTSLSARLKEFHVSFPWNILSFHGFHRSSKQRGGIPPLPCDSSALHKSCFSLFLRQHSAFLEKRHPFHLFTKRSLIHH